MQKMQEQGSQTKEAEETVVDLLKPWAGGLVAMTPPSQMEFT